MSGKTVKELEHLKSVAMKSIVDINTATLVSTIIQELIELKKDHNSIKGEFYTKDKF